jgi:hypothetical protein
VNATESYEAAFERIVAEVARRAKSEWSPTPKAKRLGALATRIDKLVDELRHVSLDRGSIEREHDYPGGCDPRSADARPGAYKAALVRMAELADSARRVQAALPSPRKRRALPFAALAYLHLRRDYDCQRPTLYDAGFDVREFGRLCRQAGLHLSDERLRGALADALRAFDRDRDCLDEVADWVTPRQ